MNSRKKEKNNLNTTAWLNIRGCPVPDKGGLAKARTFLLQDFVVQSNILNLFLYKYYG
jgi:hypothetical protein